MTEKQSKYIQLWISLARKTDPSTHGFRKQVFSQAGYSTESKHWAVEASRLYKKLKPNIRVEMYDIIDQDVPRAYNEVKEIAKDQSVSPGVRLKACERIFSLAGLEAPKQIEIKVQRIDSLTNDDLLKEIENLQKDIKEIDPNYETIEVEVL